MSSNRRAVVTALKIADVGIVAATFTFAVAASIDFPDPVTWPEILEMRVKLQNFLFLAVYFAYWHLVLKSCGLYRSYRLSAAAREMRDLTVAVLIGVAPLVALGPLMNFEFFGLDFLVMFTAAALIGMCVERRMLRAIARRVRRYGHNLHNTVIVGTGNKAIALTA